MHLDRLISVLETVATAGRPLAAAELQEITGMPLPTCYRLLQMLKTHGMLEDPDSNKRYVIGERLVRIAFLSSTDLEVRDITGPALREVAIELGELNALVFQRPDLAGDLGQNITDQIEKFITCISYNAIYG